MLTPRPITLDSLTPRTHMKINESDWLVVGSPIWEKGVPSGASLNQVNSGTAAYATNLDGNHPDDTSSSLVSPCFDLSELESGAIRFYLAYELEINFGLYLLTVFKR